MFHVSGMEVAVALACPQTMVLYEWMEAHWIILQDAFSGIGLLNMN